MKVFILIAMLFKSCERAPEFIFNFAVAWYKSSCMKYSLKSILPTFMYSTCLEIWYVCKWEGVGTAHHLRSDQSGREKSRGQLADRGNCLPPCLEISENLFMPTARLPRLAKISTAHKYLIVLPNIVSHYPLVLQETSKRKIVSSTGNNKCIASGNKIHLQREMLCVSIVSCCWNIALSSLWLLNVHVCTILSC